MKIGILYICTGKYHVFWEQFFQSAEKFLLPRTEKHYFIFTDFGGELMGQNAGKITRIFQEKLGWPYDTLMRFKMFLKTEEQLKKCDYLYFFNANMQFRDFVGEEILPNETGLIGVLHPGFYDKTNKEFPYDRNPESLAYIPEHNGVHYFMGGVNGGATESFLKLIKTLDKNTDIDLQKDVIAKWHDESHLNNYFWKNPPKALPVSYGAAEDWGGFENPKIVVLNKAAEHFGGHAFLREIPAKRQPFPSIVNKKFREIFGLK